MKPGMVLILAGGGLLGLAACGRHSPQATPGPQSAEVNVGYGSQPKDKVTGAVTSLPEQELAARPQRIEELLRGKVAGLQVVQGANGVGFRIRGTNSLIADQDALVIVDGVMIQTGALSSALAGLTPDDIKQVTVLKDVASTSIYGGRGAGGVILISTKR